MLKLLNNYQEKISIKFYKKKKNKKRLNKQQAYPWEINLIQKFNIYRCKS